MLKILIFLEIKKQYLFRWNLKFEFVASKRFVFSR